MESLSITVGAGRKNAIGERRVVQVNGVGPATALAYALSSIAPAPDAWWSGHLFEKNHRQEQNWCGSAVAMVDVDYRVTGEKKPSPPVKVRLELERAARAGALPGNLFHHTPHGARVAFVLEPALIEPRAMKSTVLGACALVRQALGEIGVADDGARGYVVDRQAVDLARFMFTPGAIVDGEQRAAEVVVLPRAESYTPAELAAEAAAQEVPPAPITPERTARPATAHSDLDQAVAHWNGDHPLQLPRPGAGDCPVCGGKGGFGALPSRPGKWFCWHVNHPENAGHRTDRGTWGDALDLEAAARGRSRLEILRDGRYLAPRCGAPTKAGKICANTNLGPDGKCAYHSTVKAAPVAPALRVVPPAIEREPGSDDEDPTGGAPPSAAPVGLPTLQIGQIPDPGPVTWAIATLWTTAAFGIVGALPKSWKSYFSLYLAICVSTGAEVFGKFKVRRGPVLLFSAEGGKKSVRRRCGMLCRALAVEVATVDIHVLDVALLRLDDPAQLAAFIATVERVRPALVIVDPLREVHTGDENDSGYVTKLFAPLRELVDRVGCAMMFVHHSVKPGVESAKRRPAERLRGSGALVGALDSGLFLEAKGEGNDKRVEVSAIHRDAPEPDPFTIALRRQDTPEGEAVYFELVDSLGDEEEIARAVAARDKARKLILHAIGLASMPGRERIRNKSTLSSACRLRKATVVQALKELAEEGLIQEIDGVFLLTSKGKTSDK
jgi:hypothetical protein